MPFPLLPALIAVSAPIPPEPPKPAAEVVIQARQVLIPHVPSSLNQAQAEYGRIASEIAHSMNDLESQLRKLYEQGLGPTDGPTAFTIRKSEMEAARTLQEILADRQYEKLEADVILAWNRWQSVLLEMGLAKAENPTDMAAPATVSDKRLMGKARLADPSRASWELERQRALDLSKRKGGSLDVDQFFHILNSAGRHRTQMAVSQKAAIIADQKAPELARHWEALVHHLDAAASRLLDLESPSTILLSQGGLELRRQAKMCFLERCRSTLHFCQTVWARMTGNTVPSPLTRMCP